jgi:hypothetical protein
MSGGADLGESDRTPAGPGASGRVTERLLAELDRSANISLTRPTAADTTADPVEAAALALAQATRRSSPFSLVPADPLAVVAAEWQGMWDLSRGGLIGAVLFEEQVAHALAAWRARRFELPDYYLVLAGIEATGGPGAGGPSGTSGAADFYLGPVRAARPHRVAVVAGADGPEQAAEVRDALRSLRPGPWWPPLDELLDTARRFFAGGLAEASTALASPGR